MGQPSFEASNAIIYLTYGAFLVIGTGVAWRLRNQSKGDFLAGNRTQTAFPLALNFIASGELVATAPRAKHAPIRAVAAIFPRATNTQIDVVTAHQWSDDSPFVPILVAGLAGCFSAVFELLAGRPWKHLRSADHGFAFGEPTLQQLIVPGGVPRSVTAAHYGRGFEHDPWAPTSVPFALQERRLELEASAGLAEMKLRLYPLGSGILFSYPQLATLAGVQGVVVYALSSALPLMVFAALGPIIRRKCPEGFVLTEWTRQRYGLIAALYLSFMTLVTLFLYMVSELSAVGQVVNALTGLDGLPVVIVECVVTTIYTSLGGFKISFLTDNIQGAMVVGLIVIGTVAVGVETHIDPSLVDSSGLTQANLLGWQLLYIFPVAILTNDFFLSSFWLRTFASKTDRDLWIGVSTATVVLLIVLTLVGSTGLIAAWAGLWPGDPEDPVDGSVAFFVLLETLPNWVVGIVIVMSVTLSTAAFDSLQSAMVSSASNDLFRNRLNVWYIRAGVVLIMIPVVILALKAPSILQIFLISDLLSAATIPVLVVGLWDKCYWWRGFEVIVGGLGGILTVFIFGTIYYGDALTGAQLILLEQGLYEGDWGAFGAFVAAPFGGILWGFGALALRLAFQFTRAKVTGQRFDALDRPAYLLEQPEVHDHAHATEDEEAVSDPGIAKGTGKFF